MMKIPYVFKALAVVFCLIAVYACERDDKEPNLDTKKFSRLYVSFEEFGTSNVGVPDTNVRIIFPADSSEFKYSLGFVSGAKGGGPIYFHPFLKMLYQASVISGGVSDTSIYGMTVGDRTGLLSNTARLGNRQYNLIKGLFYHSASETLLAVNASGADAGVYLNYRPRNNGYARPIKKLKNSSLTMWGAAFGGSNLFTSKTGDDAGIYVFEKILATAVGPDSVGRLNPTRILSIADAQNLRGMSYDTVRNVLAITDFVTNGAEGTGRILIFEKFSSLINQAAIVPTRVITGAATLLKEPVDVAIDPRSTADYIYVADRSGKVLRFKLSDSGNVIPSKVVEIERNKRKLIPAGLSLDARDFSTLGQ